MRFWKIKKSFSFCAIIAIILLIATKLEDVIMGFFAEAGESFEPMFIRILVIVSITFVVFYYSFIKGED
jgi:hypothetical protein